MGHDEYYTENNVLVTYQELYIADVNGKGILKSSIATSPSAVKDIMNSLGFFRTDYTVMRIKSRG